MREFRSIGIIGGGAWGTALATVVSRAGGTALIWAREDEVVTSINEAHVNDLFLPDIDLDPAIAATGELNELADCDALLIVTPAQALSSVLPAIAGNISQSTPLVVCSKGIESTSGRFMSDIVAELVPQARPAVLSGPSFAIDVARKLPTAVTLACEDEAVAQGLAEALSHVTFRPYLSGDLLGAQIGGAVKNVLAIACGISDGKQFGASARAALTTRGFAELVRFGLALGAEAETLSGLSGLGDLILTCNSPQSRNMSLGIALGRGQSLDEVLGVRRTVSEGVHTARAVVERAERLGVEMPICAAVDAVVSGRTSVVEAITGLLSRPLRAEGM